MTAMGLITTVNKQVNIFLACVCRVTRHCEHKEVKTQREWKEKEEVEHKQKVAGINVI